MVKSVSPKNGFPHFGLSQFEKKNKFPYISVTDEASDFKFGMQLGSSKAHHKITPRRESGRGPGQENLPKIWRFPSIFTQWLKLAI